MNAETPGQSSIEKRLSDIESRLKLVEYVTGQRRSLGKKPQVVVATTPTPMKQATAPAKVHTTTEIEIGQKWLSVVGVALIFLAALFFVQFVFKYVGPAGKVGLSYFGAAVLFGVAVVTKKKYPPFAAVVAAGAWGVTYLVTYAMHFFPATRLVTSTPLAMLLLTVVVAVLVTAAVYQRSKPLVAFSLVLGFLTMVLSPLSLFSIVGTVLLCGVFVTIAVVLPWGDLTFPAAIGAYVSYFFWYSNVLGRLPVQGGGLLEKQMIGLIVLVLLWLIIAAGIMLRRDEEESLGGQTDAITLILASGGTAVLGFYALQELVLTLTTPRGARAIWFFLLAGLTGGWAMIAREYRQKKDVVAAGGVIAMLLLMGSIAYFLPEQSSGTSLAWSVLGLVVVVVGMFTRNVRIAAMSTLPLVASAIRFIASDMQKSPVPLTTDFSLNLPLGIAVAAVIIGSAALLRTLDLAILSGTHAKRLPGVLLVAGLIVFGAITAREFSGAIPSVLWGLAGLATMVPGFLFHWKDARIVGLAALAATVARVFIHDLSGLEALPRVISFAILGGLLLLVGYGYNHNREKLQKYLEE